MELAQLNSLEMGKGIRESPEEVEKCAWLCDFYAEKSREFLLPDRKQAKVVHLPIGVALG